MPKSFTDQNGNPYPFVSVRQGKYDHPALLLSREEDESSKYKIRWLSNDKEAIVPKNLVTEDIGKRRQRTISYLPPTNVTQQDEENANFRNPELSQGVSDEFCKNSKSSSESRRERVTTRKSPLSSVNLKTATSTDDIEKKKRRVDRTVSETLNHPMSVESCNTKAKDDSVTKSCHDSNSMCYPISADSESKTSSQNAPRKPFKKKLARKTTESLQKQHPLDFHIYDTVPKFFVSYSPEEKISYERVADSFQLLKPYVDYHGTHILKAKVQSFFGKVVLLREVTSCEYVLVAFELLRNTRNILGLLFIKDKLSDSPISVIFKIWLPYTFTIIRNKRRDLASKQKARKIKSEEKVEEILACSIIEFIREIDNENILEARRTFNIDFILAAEKAKKLGNEFLIGPLLDAAVQAKDYLNKIRLEEKVPHKKLSKENPILFLRNICIEKGLLQMNKNRKGIEEEKQNNICYDNVEFVTNHENSIVSEKTVHCINEEQN